MVETKKFNLETKGNCDVIDITSEVQKIIGNSEITSGIVNVFVPGSTAGITTIEFESGAVSDLREAFERNFPETLSYAHNRRWGDGNGHSHIRASMLGPSLNLPFNNKTLMLGTWQQVVLVDFDNRKRRREIILQILGE